MSNDALDDVGLCLDKRKHLCTRKCCQHHIAQKSPRTHLFWLFVHQRGVDLGEMRRHGHLGLHIVRRSVEDGLPEGHEQLVLLPDAGGDNGPDIAAQHLRRDIGVPARAR